MDARLRALEIAVHRDPGDEEARAALRAGLRRLADLSEVERWEQAAPEAQDFVVITITRLLGPSFEHVKTRSHKAGGRGHRVARLRHRPSGVELQLIPGGLFWMGSDPGGGAVRINEQPRHEVLIPPLLLGRYPLLQEQWDRIGGDDARTWSKPDLPIEGVSWDAARAWLEAAGDGLRLPSESEWEYACRARTETPFFWGARADERYCHFGAAPDHWRTHPPSEHDAFSNAFGLVDMAGNVGEWCEDHYKGSYRGAPCDGSPRAERRGDLRVVRGGDSYNPLSHCRSAARNLSARAARGAGIGFRVARDVPW